MLQKQHTCTLGLPKTNLRYQPINNKKNELYNAWGNWLNTFTWQYFTTLTTNYPLTMYSAEKAVNRFLNVAEKEFGRTQIFWVAEPFDLSHSYHLHAIINFNIIPLQDTMHNEIRKFWYKVNFVKKNRGIHRTLVQNYEKEKGGNFYIAKHFNKHNTNFGFSIDGI